MQSNFVFLINFLKTVHCVVNVFVIWITEIYNTINFTSIHIMAHYKAHLFNVADHWCPGFTIGSPCSMNFTCSIRQAKIRLWQEVHLVVTFLLHLPAKRQWYRPSMFNQSINAFIKRQRSHENRRRLREELIYFMAGWSNRCVFSELRKAAGQDVTRRWCGREFQILGAATWKDLSEMR